MLLKPTGNMLIDFSVIQSTFCAHRSVLATELTLSRIKLENPANVMFGFRASMRYAKICASIYAYCWPGVLEVRSSVMLGYISSECLVCIGKNWNVKNMRKRVKIASKSWRNGSGFHMKLLTVFLAALYIRLFRSSIG